MSINSTNMADDSKMELIVNDNDMMRNPMGFFNDVVAGHSIDFYDVNAEFCEIVVPTVYLEKKIRDFSFVLRECYTRLNAFPSLDDMLFVLSANSIRL